MALSPASDADQGFNIALEIEKIYSAINTPHFLSMGDDDATDEITEVLKELNEAPSAARQIFAPIDKKSWDKMADNAYGDSSRMPWAGVPDVTRYQLLSAAAHALPGEKLVTVTESFDKKGDIGRLASYIAEQDNKTPGVVERKLAFVETMAHDVADPEFEVAWHGSKFRKVNEQAAAVVSVLSRLGAQPAFDDAISLLNKQGKLPYLIKAAIEMEGAQNFLGTTVTYDESLARFDSLMASTATANGETKRAMVAAMTEVTSELVGLHAQLSLAPPTDITSRMTTSAEKLKP